MITNSSLHHILIKKIIEDGFAPSNEALAAHFGTNEQAVIKALYALQEYHGVVLHPNEPKVWVIHPFSLAPTNFCIKSADGLWWGNCGLIADFLLERKNIFCIPTTQWTDNTGRLGISESSR